MKEKLIIKNFGPIKSIELKLGRFNVLIGEQATGKSTVAKVLSICRYFSYIVSISQHRGEFLEGLIAKGLVECIKANSSIYYECKDYSLSVKQEIVNNNIQVFVPTLTPISKKFKNLLTELERIKPKTKNDWIIPTSFFLNDVASVMDNPFYLPTERGLQSIFSLGKSSVQNISDSLFNQFAELDQITRLFKEETLIEPLNITYKNIDGKGYIKKNNQDKFYTLYNSASGYQSTIPIVLLIKYYSEVRKKTKTFILEEPELNLFPKAQQKLMEYLVDKVTNYGNSILLTSHSPYTLTSLNNMMYAYKLGISCNKEVSKIIKKQYWLNSEDVSVYMMLPNGKCENIFDRKEGLIKAEKIDSVSGVLNQQFDKLLNIEFAKK